MTTCGTICTGVLTGEEAGEDVGEEEEEKEEGGRMGGGASRSSSSSCLSPAVSVECSEARTGKLGKPLAEVGGASVPSSVYRGSVSNTVSGDGGHRDHKLWGKHVDLACTVAGDIHVHVHVHVHVCTIFI